MPQLHSTTSHSQVSTHGGSTVGHDYTVGSPSLRIAFKHLGCSLFNLRVKL
jgi:hypothetical protein